MNELIGLALKCIGALALLWVGIQVLRWLGAL
jgi:hypothetical protein